MIQLNIEIKDDPLKGSLEINTSSKKNSSVTPQEKQTALEIMAMVEEFIKIKFSVLDKQFNGKEKGV